MDVRLYSLEFIDRGTASRPRPCICATSCEHADKPNKVERLNTSIDWS